MSFDTVLTSARADPEEDREEVETQQVATPASNDLLTLLSPPPTDGISVVKVEDLDESQANKEEGEPQKDVGAPLSNHKTIPAEAMATQCEVGQMSSFTCAPLDSIKE